MASRIALERLRGPVSGTDKWVSLVQLEPWVLSRTRSPGRFSSERTVSVPLFEFPDVVLHADESSVKRHPQYQAAKAGDIAAADLLVAELANQERAGDLRAFLEGGAVELVPIHALESAGVNEIPAALARRLSAPYSWTIRGAPCRAHKKKPRGRRGFKSTQSWRI